MTVLNVANSLVGALESATTTVIVGNRALPPESRLAYSAFPEQEVYQGVKEHYHMGTNPYSTTSFPQHPGASAYPDYNYSLGTAPSELSNVTVRALPVEFSRL